MRGQSPIALLTVIATAFAATLTLAIAILPAAEPGVARTYFSRTAQTTDSTEEKSAAPKNNVITGTPAAVLDDQDVDSILGKTVRSNSGENMGRIVDVIVSRGGHVRGVVIDFGGFLGVGTRKIAIDWSALHFNLADKSGQITVDLTKDQLRVAPEYKPGEPVVMLGAANPTAAPGSSPPAQDK